MTPVLVVLALVVGGVLLNFVVRRVLRRGDGETGETASSFMRRDGSDAEEAAEVLRTWGTAAEGWEWPAACMPVHPSVSGLLASYSRVNLDGYVVPVDRTLVALYDVDPNFVVIGDLGEGSPVMVRRASDDPRVCTVDIEDGDPGKPSVFAQSIPEYLCRTKQLYMECVRSEVARTPRQRPERIGTEPNVRSLQPARKMVAVPILAGYP